MTEESESSSESEDEEEDTQGWFLSHSEIYLDTAAEGDRASY